MDKKLTAEQMQNNWKKLLNPENLTSGGVKK